MFEGEYLKGKRNGKGKEYDDNKLIYYGEFLNDEYWNGIEIKENEEDNEEYNEEDNEEDIEGYIEEDNKLQ